ncbi:MAG: 50S ribosomal protein L18 [Patescibacteria group bacterium]
MTRTKATKLNKVLRANRTRARLNRGTTTRPRLSVFKSNQHLFLQIIDDTVGKTLVSAHDTELKAKGKKKMEIAGMLGQLVANKAKGASIEAVVFDRGPNLYHGIVKAVADGAREGGLVF